MGALEAITSSRSESQIEVEKQVAPNSMSREIGAYDYMVRLGYALALFESDNSHISRTCMFNVVMNIFLT